MESAKAKEEKKFRDFDSVFEFIRSFGRRQGILYLLCMLLKVPTSSEFGHLVYAFGNQKFMCSTPNITCPVNKCCPNCTSYSFDTSFVSVITEVRFRIFNMEGRPLFIIYMSAHECNLLLL